VAQEPIDLVKYQLAVEIPSDPNELFNHEIGDQNNHEMRNEDEVSQMEIEKLEDDLQLFEGIPTSDIM
jgi:hypothetical protein